MKESVRNFLVGLFVVLSFVVLGVLMMWFGEAPSWLGGSEWTLRITGVQELSGVGEGSPVKLNGVAIGRVQSLEFENPSRPDQGVVIVTGIKKIYTVPSNAIAKVYGATLGFGTGHIELIVEPGVGAEPLDQKLATVPGEMRSIIGELISKEMVSSVEETIRNIGDLAESATPVMNSAAALMQQRTTAQVDRRGAAAQGMTANLSTVIERLDKLVANMNAVLGDEDVQEELKTAVTNLKDATGNLRTTVSLWQTESLRLSENLNTAIDGTEENLDETFRKLTAVLDRLDDASSSLAAMLRGMEAGEGTLGLLVRDERLYESAVVTLERFSELVASFQRITAKIEEDGYITFAQKTPVGTFTKKFPIGGSDSPLR